MSGTNTANAGHVKINSSETLVRNQSGEAKDPVTLILDEQAKLRDQVTSSIDELRRSVADTQGRIDGVTDNIQQAIADLEGQRDQVDRLTAHARTLDAEYSRTGRERLWRSPASGKVKDERAEKFARSVIDNYHFAINKRAYFNDGQGSDEFRWSMTEGHKRAQNEGTLSEGGALVDDEQASYITELEEQYGLFMRILKRIEMRKNEMKMPTLTQRPIVYYPDEGLAPGQTSNAYTDAITHSQIALAQPKLTATRFMAVSDFTIEVVEDSVPAIAGYVGDVYALAFAKAGDVQAFTNSISASGGPFDGLLYKSGIQEYILGGSSSSGSTTYASTGYSDLLNVIDTVDPFALDARLQNGIGAAWIMSTSLKLHCRNIKDSENRPLWTEMAQGDPNMLFGYPIFTLEVMPTLADGTQNNKPFMLFGNFQFHAWGDRMGLRIDFSDQPMFKQGMHSARFWKRQAFQLLIGDAIARVKTANS